MRGGDTFLGQRRQVDDSAFGSVTGTGWTFNPPPDRAICAMVIAELYRHNVNGQTVRKLRAIGQGWADGLDGLARAHGVNVE